MSRVLPLAQETINKYCAETGLDPNTVLAQANEWGKVEHPSLILNVDALVYFYVKSQGKEPPKIKVVTSNANGYIKIADINPVSIGKRSFSLRGYVVDFQKTLVKSSQKPMVKFTLADESGATGVLAFHDKVEDVIDMDLKVGETAYLQGLTLHSFPKTTEYVPRVSSWTARETDIRDEDKLPPISAFNFTQLSDITIGKYAWIKSTVISQDKTFYVGCPNCFTGIKGTQKPAIGQKFLCTKCNANYPVTELAWTILVVADNSGNQIVRIPPRFDVSDLIGEEIYAVGRPNEREEFNVAFFRTGNETEIPPIAATPPIVIQQVASTNVAVTTSPPVVILSTSDSKAFIAAKEAAFDFLDWSGNATPPEIARVLERKGFKMDSVAVLDELVKDGKVSKVGDTYSTIST